MSLQSILPIAILVSVFLLTVTLHEFSHGLVAYYRGDDTAKRMGRLTLNPLKHIDPIWTVIVPITLSYLHLPVFGMARPVPVNFANLYDPKKDMIWVALAGPLANMIFASVLAVFFHWTHFSVLLFAIYLNLGLAVFNLIPIPPLDGSRILTGLLPRGWDYQFIRLERWGYFVLLALIWFDMVWRLLIPAVNFFCRLYRIPMIEM